MLVKVREWRKLSKKQRFIAIVDEAMKQKFAKEGVQYEPKRHFRSVS